MLFFFAFFLLFQKSPIFTDFTFHLLFELVVIAQPKELNNFKDNNAYASNIDSDNDNTNTNDNHLINILISGSIAKIKQTNKLKKKHLFLQKFFMLTVVFSFSLQFFLEQQIFLL